jgi:hypothetical protein
MVELVGAETNRRHLMQESGIVWICFQRALDIQSGLQNLSVPDL